MEESVKDMEGRAFVVVTEYDLQIAHSLMIREDVRLEDVDTLLTHPQVLRQCASTLSSRFPMLKLVAGEGELADPARIAEFLNQGMLPKTTATASNKVIASLHGLQVVAENLQDRDDNFTTFRLVKRT